jgi:hypothetical protein
VCRENLPPNVRVGYGYGYPRLQGPNLRDPQGKRAKQRVAPYTGFGPISNPIQGLTTPVRAWATLFHPPSASSLENHFFYCAPLRYAQAYGVRKVLFLSDTQHLRASVCASAHPWLDVAGLLSFAPGGAGASLVRVSRHRFSFPWAGRRPMRHSGQALRGLDQFNASRSRFPYFGKFHTYSTNFQIVAPSKTGGTMLFSEGRCLSFP